jgi:hypothetical protein
LGTNQSRGKEKVRPGSVGAHRKTHDDELVAIVVVIALIPITIGVPAMAVFIPPTVARRVLQ